MYLFIDTETSDLPRRRDAPASDTRSWPRIVQLAWLTCDSQGQPGAPEVHLIKPDGFVIAPGAFQKHGISTEYAAANGVPLAPVLNRFLRVADVSAVVVAHNVEFDSKVVGAELIRAGLPNALDRRKLRCTMKESTNYCQLPAAYGFKWPTLDELYTALFGQPLAQAHDAAADCTACMRCFFELKRRKVIP